MLSGHLGSEEYETLRRATITRGGSGGCFASFKVLALQDLSCLIHGRGRHSYCRLVVLDNANIGCL